MANMNKYAFVLTAPVLFVSLDVFSRGRAGSSYGGGGGSGSLINFLLVVATIALCFWLFAKGVEWISDRYGDGAAVLAVNMLWIAPAITIFISTVFTGNVLAVVIAVGGASLGYYQYTKSDGEKNDKTKYAYIGGFVLLSPFIAMLGYFALIMMAFAGILCLLAEPRESISWIFETVKSIRQKFMALEFWEKKKQRIVQVDRQKLEAEKQRKAQVWREKIEKRAIYLLTSIVVALLFYFYFISGNWIFIMVAVLTATAIFAWCETMYK